MAAQTPIDHNDVELFGLDNIFMFAVLQAKVPTTAHGKAILRTHESTMDAEAVRSELCTAFDTSTSASFKTADIMKYVMTSRMTDGGWTDSKKNYILQLDDQARRFNDLRLDRCSLSILTTLLDEPEDGTRYRAKIIELVKEDDATRQTDPTLRKFQTIRQRQ